MIKSSQFLRLYWKQPVESHLKSLIPKNLINGEFAKGTGSYSFLASNPSDETVLPIEIQHSSESDVNHAVEAAENAFFSKSANHYLSSSSSAAAAHQREKGWKYSSLEQRSDALRKLAALIRRDASYFATLESLCMGMCLKESQFSIESCAKTLDYFANVIWAKCLQGNVLPCISDPTSASCWTEREPIGVCGLITPFNYPLEMGIWKIAPALAAGNTLVWKSPEAAPLSSLHFAKLVQESGILPKGVLNVLQGGRETGQRMVRHPGIKGIGFTGSISAGKLIQSEAALSNLKRTNLELGGNCAAIIEPQYTDIAGAAEALLSCFANCGQSCTSARRVYVHQSQILRFVDELVILLKKRKLGHALSPDVDQGPMVSAEAMTRVLEKVSRCGGDVVVGGFRPTFPAGYFVAPTVVAGLSEESELVKEELFGPVMCVLSYDGEIDEALHLANQSPYGLSAAIFSNHMKTALRSAREINVGTVWINCTDVMSPATPFGGVKLSGYGKDLGESSVLSYSQQKTITLSLA